MFLRVVGLLLFLVAAACKPSLRDGAYACAERGACPDGWYCHTDGRCRSTPEHERGDAGLDASPGDAGDLGDSAVGPDELDASRQDGSTLPMDAEVTEDAQSGEPDTGASEPDAAAGDAGATEPDEDAGVEPDTDAGGDPYPSCSASEPCSSGACAYGPDPSVDQGVCSTSCSSDATCPASGDHAGVCLAQSCLPGCTSSADCSGGSECLEAIVGRDITKVACFEVQNPAVLGTQPCVPMDMGSCPGPAGCAYNPMQDPDGLCSLRCGVNGECPASGRCIEVFAGMHHCFKPCSGAGQCGDTFVCGSFGPGGMVCLPPGWAGETPPMQVPPPPG